LAFFAPFEYTPSFGRAFKFYLEGFKNPANHSVITNRRGKFHNPFFSQETPKGGESIVFSPDIPANLIRILQDGPLLPIKNPGISQSCRASIWAFPTPTRRAMGT